MASASDDPVVSVADALANVERREAAGDPAGALTVAARALQDRLGSREVAAPLSAAELYLIERMADLATQLGQWSAADDLLSAIALATGEAGNIEGSDYASLKRAHLLVLSSRSVEAMDVLAGLDARMGVLAEMEISAAGLLSWERRSGWQALGAAVAGLLISRAYCVMAALLLEFGQFADARTVLDRAIFRLSDPGANSAARLALPVLQLMRATAMLEAGAPAEAIAAAEDLQFEAGSALRIGGLEVVGRASLQMGEFGRALREFREIAVESDRLGLHRAAIVARLDSCVILISLNQTARAEDELTALSAPIALLADAQLDARRAELLVLVGLRRSSAAAEIDLGLSATAMQSRARPAGDFRAERPRSISRSLGGFSAKFHQAALQVEQALTFGDAQDAQWSLEGARIAAGQTDSRLIRGHLTLLEGLVQLKTGDNAGALAALREAARLLREVGAGPLLWQALRGLIRAFDDDAAKERDAVSEESERLLERLLSTLDAEERAVFRLNKANAEEERLLAAIARLSEAKREALSRRGIGRWLAIRRLDRQIARFCMDLDASRDSGCPNGRAWLRAVRRVTRHSATVLYLMLPDVIAIIVIHRGRFDIGSAAVSRLAFQDKLHRWHAHMRRAFETDAKASGGPAAREIMATLADDLRLPEILGSGFRRLRIVPDGVLHAFPFAACEWDGQELVGRCAVASAAMIAPVRRRTGRISRGLVAVAEDVSGQARLDEAPDEGREVAAVLREAWVEPSILSGKAATLAGIFDGLVGAQLAHLACHGVFVPDRPEATGLLLHDGLLDLKAVEGMDLAQLEQVTLSACSAADTFLLPGRLALSLPEMFVSAGAGGVLAALWPIEDSVSRALVTRFYRYCLDHDRAEALRRAQLDCIAGFSECAFDTRSPYFWAGFRQMGDVSPLRLGPGFPSWLLRRKARPMVEGI